jgi:hypothetical protein
VRLLVATALVVAAAALAASAGAATPTIPAPAGNPSAEGADLAWDRPGIGGYLRRAGETVRVPGSDPAVGGALVAWHRGAQVTVANRESLEPLFEEPIVGVRELAVSDTWLVFRQLGPQDRVRLIAQSTADTSITRVIAVQHAPALLGRPMISGNTVVFATTTAQASWITAVDLAAGTSRQVRVSRGPQLFSPALLGNLLLYVEISRCDQRLILGALTGTTGRVLLTLPPLGGTDRGHESGHTSQGEWAPCGRPVQASPQIMWTTALAADRAYVTLLRPRAGGKTTPTIVSVAR